MQRTRYRRLFLAGGARPNIGISTTLLAFDPIVLYSFFTVYQVKSFTINANRLRDLLIVKTAPGFIVNRDGSDNDEGIIHINPLIGNVILTVYVKYKPTLFGNHSGVISISSISADTKNIVLSGSSTLAPVSSLQNYYHNL